MASRAPLLLLFIVLASALVFLAWGCLSLYGRLRRCREECKKLRLQRTSLRRELEACVKRRNELAAVAADVPAKAKSDEFIRLRKLAIRTLHPDNAPEASTAEKALRSEMFKTFWPELVRIEAGAGGADKPEPVRPIYTGPERRRQDVPIRWRDRRTNGRPAG